MAKSLIDIEKKYDVITKSLENELKETSTRLKNNVNKRRLEVFCWCAASLIEIQIILVIEHGSRVF